MEEGKNNLTTLIKENNGPMNFSKLFPIFRDCLLGLLFMHKNNIIHRDIKPDNILELSSGKVVLCDYG